MRLLFLLTLLFSFTATLLPAQVPTGAGATDFGIELQLGESRAYQQTELVPVKIRVLGRPEKKADVPPLLPQERPTVRWQFGGFLVTPPLATGTGTDSCGTEAKPCFLKGGGFGGRWDVDFDKDSDTSMTALNDYVASIPVGHYRVSALARKLALVSTGPLSASYNYPNPPETVVSNAVDLQIVRATPQWISATIASAAAVVQSEKDYEKARAAAKQLALLDTPESWTATLNMLPVQESVLLTELSSTAKPGPLCDLMQARIPAPTQAVGSQYLSTLTSVCSRANLPPFPTPAPAGPVTAVLVSSAPFVGGRLGAAVATPDPEMQAYFEKQRAYVEALMARSTSALAASLTQKQTAVSKVEAMKTLLGYIQQLQYNRPRGATPAWASGLAGAIESNLASFTSDERRALVGLFASTLPESSASSAFEAVLNRWKPGSYSEEPGEALKALYKVNPQRARERILAELTKDETWLRAEMLNLLPVSEVAPMDDALIETLTRIQKTADLPPPLLQASAIARYATAQALPRVRAIYEGQRVRCQPELVAYFLRVDAAYASQVLQSTSVPSCLPQYFGRTAALIMNPALESFIVPYLMQGDVFLKTEAAKSLGKYGSATAEKPLWDTLRYFHEYWDGKGAELAKNGEGIVLEEQLAFALGRGRAWVATEADLKTIQSLCIGERCGYQAAQDLQSWRAPMRLDVNEDGGGIRANVAQYSGFTNLVDLEAKLAQFPRGTTFLMTVSGPSYESMEASLRRVASDKGLVLESR